MEIDKQQILGLGLNILEEKEGAIKGLIASTRESNNDTKSSMGDKYETSREMLQQEINMLEKQLAEIVNQKQVFQKIKGVPTQQVGLGALVLTNVSWFFISAGIGVLELEKQKIMCVSLSSPLVSAMIGKSEGDEFIINNRTNLIKRIL